MCELVALTQCCKLVSFLHLIIIMFRRYGIIWTIDRVLVYRQYVANKVLHTHTSH